MRKGKSWNRKNSERTIIAYQIRKMERENAQRERNRESI